jgi:DNA modification methylase
MILTGDCREILPTLAAESIDCCVTSPPYWGLRDYGMDDQIGNEDTLDQYIQTLVETFREVCRVLKPEGTFWLNLGDKYAKSTPCGNGDPTIGRKPNGARIPGAKEMPYPDKCLMLIPSRVAIALIDDGWILRNEIIWAKTNPMPSSAPDRCTNSHENIFLFAKQQKYYFDHGAIAEPAYTSDRRNPRGSKGVLGHQNNGLRKKIGGNKYPGNGQLFYSGNPYVPSGNRIKRDVWIVPTAASENQKEEAAHYAKFPEKLVEPCILAGCPVGGTVLDPFSGSGTTGKVAYQLGRQYIGIELNPTYAAASEKKIGAHIQTKILEESS